ncbi:hypothetical protein EP7_005316 [Isosphaeraceae bacterium EP7]
MRQGMTPAEPRSIREKLDDTNETGGQPEPTKRLGWSFRTIRRKLTENRPIDLDEGVALKRLSKSCSMSR